MWLPPLADLAYWGGDYKCMYNDTEGAGGTPPVAVVDSYVKLPHNNYTAVMNHLAQVGPLGISV